MAQAEGGDQQRQGQVVKHLVAERPGHGDDGRPRREASQQQEVLGDAQHALCGLHRYFFLVRYGQRQRDIQQQDGSEGRINARDAAPQIGQERLLARDQRAVDQVAAQHEEQVDAGVAYRVQCIGQSSQRRRRHDPRLHQRGVMDQKNQEHGEAAQAFHRPQVRLAASACEFELAAQPVVAVAAGMP